MKVIAALGLGVLLAASGARADGLSPEAPNAWGTQMSSVATVNAWSFMGPLSDAGNGFRRCNPSVDVCRSAVDLTGGTLAYNLSIEACDTSPTTELVARLWACEEAPGNCTIAGEVHTGIAATPGCTHTWQPLQPRLPVRNWHNTYLVDVFATDGANAVPADFRAVRVAYWRELGQAPATATFGDVPLSHPFFRHIELLAGSHITGGCGNGLFCPDRPVTRGEMAVFLVEALGMTVIE